MAGNLSLAAGLLPRHVRRVPAANESASGAAVQAGFNDSAGAALRTRHTAALVDVNDRLTSTRARQGRLRTKRRQRQRQVPPPARGTFLLLSCDSVRSGGDCMS